MASRKSGHFNSEMLLGSRRGRQISGDMGWEMFPQKYEATDIIENPEQVNLDHKATIMDYGPDNNSIFAYEAPRRNTFAKMQLNIREGGRRTNMDPYQSEMYDTQFHDKDPRGWSTEQPWQEYRRQMESQLRMIDFKDDGDYSVPESGIHPNTMYKNIRSAQDWVKARLKIFETSWEAFQNGGVGVYGNVSKVYKSDNEDTSVMTDGSGMGTTFEDPVNRQNTTMKLSNIVHSGSKALRANSTTDHKVMVAAYGKLYKNRGLINHETELRLIEDDTPWSRIEGIRATPKNLVKLMSSYVHQTQYDDGNFGDGPTAAAANRALLQQTSGHEQETFKGLKNDESTLENRNNILTKDIMALLGMVDTDVKFLTSMQGKNRKQADHVLANLYELAEVVHKLPAHVKIEMRNELLLRSAGMGLKPAAGIRRIKDQVVINPKVVQFMDLMVRKSEAPGDSQSNRAEAIPDSEGKLNNLLATTPLFIFKGAIRSSENIDINRRDAENEHTKFKKTRESKTHSYKNLAKFAQQMAKNSHAVIAAQALDESQTTVQGKSQNINDFDPQEHMMHQIVDVEFPENRGIAKHVGRIGSKNMRRHMTTDYFTVDATNEVGSHDTKGKNPKKPGDTRNRAGTIMMAARSASNKK
jgi:hypothetical protein